LSKPDEEKKAAVKKQSAAPSESEKVMRPAERRKSFWRTLLKALPVILSITAITFLLEEIGWLHPFETSALDTWVRLVPPLEPRDVVLVDIGEEDYKELFGQKSPLDAKMVGELVQALDAGQPRIIGVDLETSDPSFKNLEELTTVHPVIWARPASLGEGEEKIEPGLVLGEEPLEPKTRSGIALLPQDHDGVIRHYRRLIETSDGPKESFPWVIVKTSLGRGPTTKREAGELLTLRFCRDCFTKIPARFVREVYKSEGWQKRGPLQDKIVLLGGTYSAARDKYPTPLGTMDGLMLMAHAVEADLQHGNIEPLSKIKMLVLDLAGGALLVVMHFYLSKRRLALVLSLAAIPIIAIVSSFLAFSSLALWADFVPVLAGVLLHQTYDHFKEHREMARELDEMKKAHGS
jgi:CHASE2 domain-containing sensor protein